MACSSCDTATDHCHGTLIVHTGNIAECTEDGCVELDRLRHAFVVDCFDLAGGCSCLDLIAARRAS
ncbi:hypothetical protein [Antrihabitans cavernicola]|uniref:Uncharacterized protein n=1 Tax=Antrihabitans cavernicola TaxID=2495913 RepID=A0A5A7SEI3_9NOCA|nr:hypothetical protein [Spelaeibacter cavernicola]KAA0024508.1 hypothetical protein FOY51_00645 [Spelaeibacter cavernicola]